jgi:glycosyltransferase involved in cell wall biosynthesis
MTVGEPLPLPGGTDRLLRTGLLADLLATRGHDVTWWTSTVDHYAKREFPVAGPELKVRPGLRIRFLRGILYHRNVSLRRFINHRQIASDFARSASTLPRPDIVLTSLPPLELCTAAVAFGRRTGVPVVLDIRDLWPDEYIARLPRFMRRFGPALFYPALLQARRAMRGANALVGVSETYLAWGLKHAGRARRWTDAVVTHAYPASRGPVEGIAEAGDRLAHLGVDRHRKILWFVGRHAGANDGETLIAAAEILRTRADVQLVLSGDGEHAARWRALAEGLPNVVMTGWVDRPAIAYMLSVAWAGLAAYRAGALVSLTNKVFEYAAGGVPVVLAHAGEASAVVRERGLGLVCRPGDPAELAATIERLVSNPELRDRLSASTREAFAQSFSAEVLYPRFADHLEAVAADRSR